MKLSVILVAYDSQKDLQRLLPSLFAQQGVEFETLVVDNRPGDGTAEWLAAAYPQVRVIAEPSNPGYAGGNNLGFAAAKGEWCLVLNPDTELHPGSLKALMAAAQAHPKAFVTPKLVQPDGTVNAVGLEMHYTGITSCKGLGEPPARFGGVRPVALVSGAAFVAPAEALRRLGGFDTDYGLYHEEVDLSLRARLLGYELLCAADAAVTHHYGLRMTARKFEWLERNRLLTLLKVLEERTLRRSLPGLVLTELATWAFALLKGPAYLKARWNGYRWLWANRAAVARKRRAVQETRQVPDQILLAEAQARLPFEQLVDSPRLAGLLETLTTPLYRLARPFRSVA